MLEDAYSTNLKRLLESYPCEISIPSHLKESFGKKGVCPTTEKDDRRYVRYYFSDWAILELGSTLPCIPREPTVSRVITRNISRGGIAFLHSNQLFPGELATLWLSNGKLDYEVVRCTCHNDRCFEIAAHTDYENPIPVPMTQLND